VQVIQFAGRAVQLAKELFGDNIEQNFLNRLELAKSNIPEHGDGSHIYEKFVKPAMIDLTKVTAHFAVSSLFEEYNKQARIYCYNIDLEDFHKSAAGKAKLASGRVRVTSEITKESALLGFGALHFGGHNVNAGVREYQGDESYQIMLDELTQTFTVADFPRVIRLLDKHFGMSTYSMRDLFRDEQRKVLDSILESALAEIEVAYQQVYEHHYPPMRFLSELGNPIPKSFQSAAEFIMNSNLRRAISSDHLDQERIRDILNETQMWQVELDNEGLSYIFQQAIERIMARFVATPDNADHLRELLAANEMLSALPFPVDLWQVQNLYHQMLMTTYLEHQTQAQQGNQLAKEWLASFTLLGNRLSIKVN